MSFESDVAIALSIGILLGGVFALLILGGC